jgi:hypothetical protein
MESNSVNLQDPPVLQNDPMYQQSVQDLYDLSQALTTFNFTGNLSPLNQMITTSPETLSAMFSGLQPYINQLNQNTIAQLAANNQLESSVTANALNQNTQNITNMMLGATVPLISQNISNIGNLFNTGLGLLGNTATLGLSNQAQVNQFNLLNYENLVAQAYANQQDQGGLFGGLLGGIGGALGGSIFGFPVIGGLTGGIIGGFGSSGAGSSLLTAGAGLYGTNQLSNTWRRLFGRQQ